MQLADLDYILPVELIAQEPVPERTSARLLVVSRAVERMQHATVAALPTMLRSGDLLVLNDSRVFPARTFAHRPSGGRLEVLFVRPVEAGVWEVVVRGGPRVGERVEFEQAEGQWTARLGGGSWHVRVQVPDVMAWLDRVGDVPLPPYIRRPGGPRGDDCTRYQTVYARRPGSVAAPTAGLHLTESLLGQLREVGVEVATVTLHVGPGTFLPVRTATLDDHVMHAEAVDISVETARCIGEARRMGRRVVAVGTTTVRALESAAGEDGIAPGRRETALFIQPGHVFRAVDALLTNFHLPKSTLLALVAAFTGLDRLRAAYEEAIRERYRFYSFGDAMLIQ